MLRVVGILVAVVLLGAAAPVGAQTATASATASPLPRGVVRVHLSVATRALQRGDTLQAGDIAVVDTTMIWRWTNVAPDTTRAQIGWMVNRPIAAGEVLRAPAVGAPPVVMAGRAVSVVYQDGPVRLQLAGVATNSAPLGAPVGVRIDATRRLDGIAVAPNTVRLR